MSTTLYVLSSTVYIWVRFLQLTLALGRSAIQVGPPRGEVARPGEPSRGFYESLPSKMVKAPIITALLFLLAACGDARGSAHANA